jgi:RHS repeat-associated protein
VCLIAILAGWPVWTRAQEAAGLSTVVGDIAISEGAFLADYFETLTANGDGSFTIAYKDGMTEKFRTFAGCPYFFKSPLYQLVERRDRNGNTTVLSYDGQGRLTTITDTYGRQIRLTHNAANNKIETVTDPLDRLTRVEHRLQGDRLTRIVDPAGKTVQFEYDGLYRLARRIDKNSRTNLYSLTSTTRLAEVLDPEGNRQRVAFLVNSNQWRTDATALSGSFENVWVPSTITNVDGRGFEWVYAYDRNGYLTAVKSPEGGLRRFAYSSQTLQVISETNANGYATKHEYDAKGNRTKTIDPLGNVTLYTYEPTFNQVASVTDASGYSTTYTYDAKGNRVGETDALGSVRQWTYDAHGNVRFATGKRGGTATYVYDSFGNLERTLDPGGGETGFVHEVAGNLLSRTDANLHTTLYTYDSLDRLTRVQDALGGLTRYAYDARGLLTTVTNALGHVTRYTYDAVGNLTGLTDANSQTTEFAYDEIDRLVLERYPDAAPNSRGYTYDAVGSRLTRTDQQGRTTTYRYNDLGFLTQRDYATDADDTFTYDLSGRMLTAEKGGWLVTFAYDGANRVTQTVQNGRTIGYAYDIPGRTRTLTYPGGRVVTEQMDARARLAETADAGSATPLAAYTYDLANLPLTRAGANGADAAYEYDAENRSVSVEHTVGIGRVAGFAYAHDSEGNKQYEAKTHNLADSEAYQYDDAHRLTGFRVGTLVGGTVPAPVTQSAWTLDPVGNWHSRTTDGATESRTHNAMNEIATIDGLALAHDDNGNLADDRRCLYAHDEENRPIEVRRKSDGAVLAQYAYDALGRRVVKLANLSPPGALVETQYFHDSARAIEDQDSAGATLATYVYGNGLDEVLSMDRGGTTHYFHANALGSVAAVTDATGAVAERYAYDAYGFVTVTDGAGVPVAPYDSARPRSAIGNRHLFTGRELDDEFGLYHYRARQYDPRAGRFLERDPLGFGAGQPNLYEYVKSNPLAYSDPFGLSSVGADPPLLGGLVERFEAWTARMRAEAEQAEAARAAAEQADVNIEVSAVLARSVLASASLRVRLNLDTTTGYYRVGVGPRAALGPVELAAVEASASGNVNEAMQAWSSGRDPTTSLTTEVRVLGTTVYAETNVTEPTPSALDDWKSGQSSAEFSASPESSRPSRATDLLSSPEANRPSRIPDSDVRSGWGWSGSAAYKEAMGTP